MRPDQHPDLQSMGPGEPTCDVCITKLFPHIPDEVCRDCTLNPIHDISSKRKFLRAAIERSLSLPEDELRIQIVLNDLANHKEEQ